MRVLILILIYIVPNIAISQLKDTITTDEIIITGNRNPQLFSEIGRSITSITKENIIASTSNNLYDLLKKTTSIDVKQRGNFGVQTDLSIRGSNSDQIQILINGININDPQTGHNNMHLPIDLNSISKIEVLQGSGSRIYGPNAFAGVINFITEIPEKATQNYGFSYGENNTWSANYSSSFRTNNYESFLSISKNGSDGYITNTDYKMFNFFYNGILKTPIGKFNFQTSMTDKAYGANSFYSSSFPDQYEEISNMFISIKYDDLKENNMIMEVYGKKSRDEFRLFRDTMPDWYTSHNYHMTDIFGFNQKHRFISILGITNYGLNIRSENLASNVMGNPMMPEKIPGQFYKFYTKSLSRLLTSGFLEHEAIYGNFSFSTGVSVTGIRGYDWMIEPGLDLNYKITSNFAVFSNFNQAHRIPTFTDLYYSDPVSQGNKDLKVEEATSFEFGFKYFDENTVIQAAVYQREGNNLIDWIKAPGDSLWRSTNIDKLNSFGVDASINHNPKFLKFRNFSLDRIYLNYSYNSIDKSEQFISEYVLNNLKQKIIIGLDCKFPLDLDLNINYSNYSRNGKYLDINDGKLKEFNTYSLLDAKLQYGTDKFRIYLQITNITNTKYFDISNVQLPGRWIGFGINGSMVH